MGSSLPSRKALLLKLLAAGRPHGRGRGLGEACRVAAVKPRTDRWERGKLATTHACTAKGPRSTRRLATPARAQGTPPLAASKSLLPPQFESKQTCQSRCRPRPTLSIQARGGQGRRRRYASALILKESFRALARSRRLVLP